jgi:alkylation response protein AidB-like acyl-CoA dehydrogenase
VQELSYAFELVSWAPRSEHIGLELGGRESAVGREVAHGSPRGHRVGEGHPASAVYVPAGMQVAPVDFHAPADRVIGQLDKLDSEIAGKASRERSDAGLDGYRLVGLRHGGLQSASFARGGLANSPGVGRQDRAAGVSRRPAAGILRAKADRPDKARTGAVKSMAVVADPYTEKTDEQKAITEMVHQFADEQIIPNAEHYDHEDLFPEPIVEQMKELGLFGVTIPEEYGGMGLDLTTYAMIVEELSRGWISISGIVNTHFIGSYLLMQFGSEEQRHKYLPRMAAGEIRAAFSLSEPELGSDVQAIKTSGTKQEDGSWEINGQKMWVTNGLLSSLVFVLVKTDPQADPRHRGFTCFIAEKEPGASENTGAYKGLNVPPKIKKLGYKGVESTELVFDGYRCPAENILGGEEAGLNRGFAQMMDALEVGRVNVAARGVGIAQRALELALRYSQERKTFGRPIAEHQAIQFKLADMATQVDAARLLTLRAARMKDAGERSDLEAGMAKLFASEAGRFCVEESFRIHGGYGYSKEYEIERLYRDAPLLLIGEGTSEIQRMVIGRKLLARHKI